MAARFAPDAVQEDRRGFAVRPPDNALVSLYRTGFELDEYRLQRTLVATRGEHLALMRSLATFRDGASGPAEVEALTLTEVDADERIVREIVFDVGDERAAYDVLDARYLDLGPEPFANAAWRASLAMQDAIDRRDRDALSAIFAPASVRVDRHFLAHTPNDLPAPGSYEVMLDLDEASMHRTLLATRGEHMALVRTLVWFRDGVAGPAEVSALTLIEVDEHGTVIREVAFDAEDLTDAYTELDARFRASGAQQRAGAANLASRSLQRALDAFDTRDWQTLHRRVPPGLHD